MIDLSAFKPKTYYTPPVASDNPLRRRRGELRLSAEEAAGRLGISLENLRAWEYRKAVPAPRQVEAIARAYELPVEKALLMRCELALGRLFRRAGCACMQNLPCPEGKRSCGHPRAVHKGG